MGIGAVQAQVTADMDFTRTESTNEIFDPNVALRSEQTSEDISNNAVVAGPPGGFGAQSATASACTTKPASANTV